MLMMMDLDLLLLKTNPLAGQGLQKQLALHMKTRQGILSFQS
jgi:hypothetical protein